MYHCFRVQSHSVTGSNARLLPPVRPLRQEILDAITHVCDSQTFILGPRVAAFETAAAAACASSFAVGCASGTDALWLALAAAGIGDSTAAGAPSLASETWAGAPAVIT